VDEATFVPSREQQQIERKESSENREKGKRKGKLRGLNQPEEEKRSIQFF